MKRLWSVYFVILLFYISVTVRLVQLQVFSGYDLRQQAQQQHNFELNIPARRGEIEDYNGHKIVINQPAYLLYAQPRLIKNVDEFTRKITEHIKIDEFQRNRLYDKSLYWVPVARKVDLKIAEKLQSKNIEGLGFEKESKRLYPEASTAASLLGFVGLDNNGNDLGYFGVEGYYDRELRGQDGVLRQERDARGRPIFVGNIKRVEPVNGRTLVLWLDRTVQNIIEEKLSEGIAKYGAKAGNVVVMDPKTGGILGLATYPKYDPAKYQDYSQDLYKNPVVAESYEPGSTFKVLVMSAGINEKLITPNTSMDESGPTRIGQYFIRTWDNKYHGNVTMTDVLVHSSNVGMVYVAQKLGLDKMFSYISNFGFGNITGVDLQEETSPAIRSRDQWKEIDVATSSFGQGIAVTPIQMISAISAVANDGLLLKPQVVAAIKGNDGQIVRINPETRGQILTPAAARITTEMMIAAVNYGEAKWAKPKGYRIAGKTGTAQIPVAGHYDANKTIASFVGFAPADDPKFVILVTLNEPTSSPWGSETAAPLFFRIAEKLFDYYTIPPDMP